MGALLCIDSGNTRLKWGLHDGVAWTADGALSHHDVLKLKLALRGQAIDCVWVANVAGEAAAEVIRAMLPVAQEAVHFVRSEREGPGVRNGYRVPVQLGVDRWCALIGARAQHDGACIVVSAGTATTVDTLDADGRFVGGLILPGVDMMRTALARNTAQLPLVQGHWQAHPDSTADAILTGCLEAQCGAIERAFARIVGRPGAVCLLGGGSAPVLEPHLECPVRPVRNLVLEGLRQLAAHDS